MKTEIRKSLHVASAAFTLVELVVTIALLTGLVLLVTSLMNGASAIIMRGTKAVDADAQARLVFDRLAADFGRMVRRSDIDFLGKGSGAAPPMNGNDQIAFYAGVPGYYSSPSPTATPGRNSRNSVSVVAYAVAPDRDGRPQLVRAAKGLTWEAGGAWQDVGHLPVTLASRWPALLNLSTTTPRSYSGMDDADFEPIGDSVVRFEYCYLLRAPGAAGTSSSTVPYNSSITGHTPADFYQDVSAIVVAVAVLDPTSRVIVSDYSQLTSQTLFADAADMEITPSWVAALNRPSFATDANIPSSAASAVRVYQRRFFLAGPN